MSFTGTPRLYVTFTRPTLITPSRPSSQVDIDTGSLYGAAPELVDPQRFGLTDSGPIKESDVYALGVLTWQVSLILERLIGDLFNRVRIFLGFRGASSILQREYDCRFTRWQTVVDHFDLTIRSSPIGFGR